MSASHVTFEDGVIVHGHFPDADVLRIVAEYGPFPLTIADPPYGNIVDKDWDRMHKDQGAGLAYAHLMMRWTRVIEQATLPGGALYVWGGIGIPRQDGEPAFRPFFHYLSRVESDCGFRLSSLITWKKRRAYGIQWGYLFTREELAYFVLGDVKKPRKFAVPLLEEKRGYAGYNAKYPAKSEFLRRTNVWDDVTEIFQGKAHVNQKPRRLMEIPIEVHTEPGEYVFDPFAGSGTTAHAARALGRRFVLVEQDKGTFDRTVESLRA